MKTSLYILTLSIGLLCGISPATLAQFSFSGQLRTRSELLSGQGSPLEKGSTPAFFTSQRTRLTAGYQTYRMKFGVTVQDVRVWGQDASTNNRTTNANLNGLMLHEAWGEISLLDTAQIKKGNDLALKIGRQELLYDDSRLLGNLDWLQQARRHDAAVLKYSLKGFYIHLGAAYNQNRELKTGTIYDGTPVGYAAGTNGIGTMYKSMEYVYANKKLKQGYISFLALKDDFQKYTTGTDGVKTLQKGTWSRATVGPYLQTSIGKSWNITASTFFQFGKDKTGRELNAYMYSVKASYAINKAISIGPGYDFTSGSTAGSSQNKTFDPLYGTPHKFWGQMDYFYAANGFGNGGLSDLYIHSTIKASQKLMINADLHQFSSPTTIINANDEKLSGNLGNELDIITNYTLTKYIGFQAGYCTYLTTNSLAQIKSVKDPQKMANWAYLMINIKPEFFK